LVLRRQGKDRLPQILAGILRILRSTKRESVVVPYFTRLWVARSGK
jgi:hypothetical protein